MLGAEIIQSLGELKLLYLLILFLLDNLSRLWHRQMHISDGCEVLAHDTGLGSSLELARGPEIVSLSRSWRRRGRASPFKGIPTLRSTGSNAIDGIR